MKKIFLTLIVTAFVHANTNAQSWFTVKAGGGISTVLGYKAYESPIFAGSTAVQSGTALQGGIGYKYQVSKRMELEGNILFDSRAFQFPLGVLDKDSNQTYYSGGATYLQVPLTVRYNIPFRKKVLIPYRVDQPKSGWFIEGGPYVAYGTSVNTYMDPALALSWTSADGDTLPASALKTRKIDVGVTGGIGLNFPINEGKSRITIGARGNYGLLNLYKDSRMGKATNFAAIGYLGVDFSLTDRKHIRHRW